jgi:uncharacterized membrane protein
LAAGLGTAGFASLPIIGPKVLHTPYVWPPLGSFETFAAPTATAVIAIVGALPSFFKQFDTWRKWRGNGLGMSVILVIVALFFYVLLLLSYVKGVETPNNGTQYRTVGSQRTQKAQDLFHDQSDEKILEQAGLSDGDIEEMWTSSSVREARLQLFSSYLVALMALNFAIGTLTYADRKTPRQKPTKK